MITTLPSAPVPVSAPQHNPLQQLQARIESTLEGLKHTRHSFVSSMEQHLSELQTLRDTLNIVSQPPASPGTARLPGIPLKQDTAPIAPSSYRQDGPSSLADLPPLPEMPLSPAAAARAALPGTSPFSTLPAAAPISFVDPRSLPVATADASPFSQLPTAPPPAPAEALSPISPFAKLAEQEPSARIAAAAAPSPFLPPVQLALPVEPAQLPLAQPATAPSPFAATLAPAPAASPFLQASFNAEPASSLPPQRARAYENLPADQGKQPILWGALAAPAPAAPAHPQPTSYLRPEPPSSSTAAPFPPAAASPFAASPAASPFAAPPSPAHSPFAAPVSLPVAPQPAASPFASSSGFPAPAAPPFPPVQQPMPELENATMDELNAALAKAFSQVATARPIPA